MCGIGGILSKHGKLIEAKKIITLMDTMNYRYNGLGGGFSGYGIYPKYKELYALHILYRDEIAKERLEESLKDEKIIIYKEEEIPTRNIKEIPKEMLSWRYFVDTHEDVKNKDDYIVDLVMGINQAENGAFVCSSGKNMGVFKATGYPKDVARLFKVDKYKGHIWLGHGRFPTNTPGWWGGAHPFNILDWSVVHNGEISSYGINRRYLETWGYKCTLLTDTEVVAYLCDLLVRRHKLPLKIAAEVLTPDFWKHTKRMSEKERKLLKVIRMTYGSAMLNGPFGIIVANRNSMMGLNDRIKLRPLIAAETEDFSYLASEEAAIMSICSNPDKIWAPKAGEPVIARVLKNE
ncbi:MAG: glutamine amidotransferase family protein [Candidatus Hydrothermarchaeota archaeon]